MQKTRQVFLKTNFVDAASLSIVPDVIRKKIIVGDPSQILIPNTHSKYSFQILIPNTLGAQIVISFKLTKGPRSRPA
jgi:hypothetical protein